MNRTRNFRAGRYPRSLQTLAAEYARIRIYRANDIAYMRNYCYDMRVEMNRLVKYKSTYKRQRAEILRLRLLVRALREHRANVVRLQRSRVQIKEQKSRIESLEKNVSDMRHARCQMYRDWRDTHSRCSKLMTENSNLQEELEEVRNKNVSILREMSQFSNDFSEMQTHLFNRINSLSKL